MEIPADEHLLQFSLAVELEFEEYISHMRADVYGAKFLSIVRNRGWRLLEIIVDDALVRA